MERYERIQTTTALRNQNSAKAYRILDIIDKHLFFQLWLNSDEQRQIQVSMPEVFIPADGRAIAI